MFQIYITGKFGLAVKMKQGKANRVLPREFTGHSKHLIEDSTHG